MEKKLLKLSEVTQILGIGRSLVYELVARRELPSVRIGRCIRVSSESLQKWVRDHETAATTEPTERQQV